MVTWPEPGTLATAAQRPPASYHGPPAAYPPYPQYAKPGWRGTTRGQDKPRTEAQEGSQERFHRLRAKVEEQLA